MAWALIGLSACQTPLPAWDHHGVLADGGASADGAAEPRLSFDPPAPPDAVTRITRIEVELAREFAWPRVVLVEGTLTSTQLRDLARPAITQALSARAQPVLVFTSSDTALVVAPLASLAAGTLYTVGVSDPPVALSFTIAADDGPRILTRLWPDPEDPTLPATAAVWCGPDALAVENTAVTLAPAAVPGRLARGTGGMVAAAACVSWFPIAFGLADAAPTAVSPAITPAWVPLAGGAIALLEPVVLWPGTHVPPPESVPCRSGEVGFGSGCASVADDRIVVRPPSEPVLWTIEGAATIVRRSRGERSFVVRPLPANARFHVAVLDASGGRLEQDIAVDPAPPKAHVVINEVMANPSGVERAQEWVELFNDGLYPVAIGGYGLETGGGSAIFPDGVLAPGGFALVVTDAYVDDDGVDPVAAPGTLIVRVPALGRDGLSNEGERLVLRDGAGDFLSSFPALKAKSARVTPDALDTDLESFVASPNGSATPGAPNAPR